MSRRAQHARRGTSLTELIVACTLLGSMMLLVAPIAVRVGRCRQDQRHARVAMDELSNQLDRLTQLPADTLKQAITELQPSDFARNHLREAELQAELRPSENGQQLTLSLAWNRLGSRRAKPATLSTWVYSSTESRPPTADEEP